MLSALLLSGRSYPAVAWAGQLAHQRSSHLGPLVLEMTSLNVPTPTTDRDRTVSRRSEPSSRDAFMGEQPNPWDLLQPRMRRADIEVPNLAVDVNSWARSACYPRGSFYPLSHTPSTRKCGITKPDFRPCSTCPSRSQVLLCLYTLCGWCPFTLREPLSASVTLWEATAPVKLPAWSCEHTGSRLCLRDKLYEKWYFTCASLASTKASSKAPTYAT